ncbi:MAG: hypothetical protein GF330_07455 [Candidatus Eisenbacteria bacterium]|nr:hypothetical protein [Candidatus Eisenbacteria bacterium]
MDDYQEIFASTEEFSDVACLVLLKKDKQPRLEKMVRDRPLPLLQDTPEVDFENVYGMTSSRPWRVFDRRGCVAADSLGLRLKDAGSPEPLMELLREIDER